MPQVNRPTVDFPALTTIFVLFSLRILLYNLDYAFYLSKQPEFKNNIINKNNKNKQNNNLK